MPIIDYHIFAWIFGCKLQKNHKEKTFSFNWVVDLKKRFKTRNVEDPSRLSSHGMKCVVIEKKLMEPIRKEQEYT